MKLNYFSLHPIHVAYSVIVPTVPNRTGSECFFLIHLGVLCLNLKFGKDSKKMLALYVPADMRFHSYPTLRVWLTEKT